VEAFALHTERTSDWHDGVSRKQSKTLGRYDGKVYEDLFNRAHRLNPLNKITFNPNYWEDEIIKGSRDGGLKGEILSKL
jgi:hypothetical protein